MSDMKVIVVGKGGREHAIVRALKESSSDPQVHAWPGSDAIFELARPVDGVTCIPELLNAVKEEGIHLVVAGEESYLMQGLADACEASAFLVGARRNRGQC